MGWLGEVVWCARGNAVGGDGVVCVCVGGVRWARGDFVRRVWRVAVVGARGLRWMGDLGRGGVGRMGWFGTRGVRSERGVAFGKGGGWAGFGGYWAGFGSAIFCFADW